MYVHYLKSFVQVKMDKWTKMLSQDEYSIILNEFLEKGDCRVLLISLTSAGQLQPSNKFPSSLKNKAVYFVKKWVMQCMSQQFVPDQFRIFFVACIHFELQPGEITVEMDGAQSDSSLNLFSNNPTKAMSE